MYVERVIVREQKGCCVYVRIVTVREQKVLLCVRKDSECNGTEGSLVCTYG